MVRNKGSLIFVSIFRFIVQRRCGTGKADIGLLPCAELDRLGLDFLPDLGIACEGPVRSILLISRRPFEEIRTLAVDSSSRTSVALARIILAERYGLPPAHNGPATCASRHAGG